LNNPNRLLVIGANAAGMAAALRARRRRPDLDITVVERSERVAVANCAIPDFLHGRIATVDELQQLTLEQAREKHNLNILTTHKAVDIDPVRRYVSVTNLSTNQTFDLDYDALILATGADPIRPDWPNKNAPGVFTLRDACSAQSLRDFLERRKPESIAVIGTGTIAQGTASALSASGAKVTLIGLPGDLMVDLEPSINAKIIATLISNGINVYFSDNIYGFKVSLDGKVTGIVNGDELIPCECVLLAVGIRPNTELAKTAGISLGINGAIRVDRHLATSRSRIFACGDCAETHNRITNKPIYWPLATTAARQGRQAGESASGGIGQDPGTLMTRLWICFDLQVGRVGLSSRQAIEGGFKVQTTEIKALSKPKHAGGDEILLVLVNDRENGRILGAQAAGRKGILSRINTLAAAIVGKLTLSDLEGLDLGYTPELSTLWDPVLIAGRLGKKKIV
jgi:NADPH-dependent 2,4-dienoyl-CoA reductase/sulfur reductase-like enzyme